MTRTFALAEVKSVGDGGEFEAVLSVPTLDRDGEVIDVKAFEPLPPSIPVHAFHDFTDPIARGIPSYEGEALMLRGTFASTPRAQEIRTLAVEGVIGSMSVGFMTAARLTKDDGVTHITKAELLEGSFVSVPSNRDAAITAVKSGARNSAADNDRLQEIHDLSVANGAACEGKHAAADEEKSTTSSEQQVPDRDRAADRGTASARALIAYGEASAVA